MIKQDVNELPAGKVDDPGYMSGGRLYKEYWNTLVHLQTSVFSLYLQEAPRGDAGGGSGGPQSVILIEGYEPSFCRRR